MRKTACILLLLASVGAAAQSVKVTDFRQVASEVSDPRDRTSHVDVNGEQCAVVRVRTEQEGWTFDAGIAGIVDTRSEKGAVCLYLPSGARTLSFSHYRYGVLRNWPIPVSLVPGATYELKLSNTSMQSQRPAVTPAPVRTVTTVSAPKPSPRPVSGKPATRPVQVTVPYGARMAEPVVRHDAGRGERTYCTHFIDGYYGHCLSDGYYDSYIGLRYSYMKFKVGPYASLAFSVDEEVSAFAGACIHLLPEQKSDFDMHAYAGLGLAEGCLLAGELGVRLAWKTDYSVSRWDFGFGVQMWEGCVMPTVSVGFYIWGIPVAVGVGLVCAAAGGMM